MLKEGQTTMDNPRIKITNTEETYKKKKKSNHPQDTKKFKHLKQTIQKKSRQTYWKCIEEIVTPENNEEVHSVPKRFWAYIKLKKSDKCGVAPLRKNGRLETDTTNKANILNEQFQSVFSSSTNIDREEFYNQNYMADSQEDYPDSGDINITNTGVEKLLNNLNPHKAAGPDNIRPMVLKELASKISPILSIIYNVSIKAGEIPYDWRSAVITPAFKKGQKYVPANYRPIHSHASAAK